MARILVVGTVTVDHVLSLERYPTEDEKVRCQSHHRRRGGNAATTAVMLSRLGHEVFWAGTVGNDVFGKWVRADFGRWNVDLSLARTVAGPTPISYVLRSKTSGSRTIVHHRSLPEFSADGLVGEHLAEFDWVHFEGRDPLAIGAMIGEVDAAAPMARTSLEVEKHRTGIETLFPGVDILLFSKSYARSLNMTPQKLFSVVHADAPDAQLVCAWGRRGAYALGPSGGVLTSPALPPREIVDTLGAGDVFNAAMIDGLLSGSKLASVLDDACALAARKCAHEGFAFPLGRV